MTSTTRKETSDSAQRDALRRELLKLIVKSESRRREARNATEK